MRNRRDHFLKVLVTSRTASMTSLMLSWEGRSCAGIHGRQRGNHGVDSHTFRDSRDGYAEG